MARKLELPINCPAEAQCPGPDRSFWVREEKPRYGAAPHWSFDSPDSSRWNASHPPSPNDNPPTPDVEPDPGASRRNRFAKNVRRTRRLPRKLAIGLQNKGYRLFEVFLYLRERGALGVGPRQLLHPTHVALGDFLVNRSPVHVFNLIPALKASTDASGQRLSIEATFRPTAGPEYSLSGRNSRLSCHCSSTCAVHPAIRAIAKIGVNRSVGIPKL